MLYSWFSLTGKMTRIMPKWSLKIGLLIILNILISREFWEEQLRFSCKRGEWLKAWMRKMQTSHCWSWCTCYWDILMTRPLRLSLSHWLKLRLIRWGMRCVCALSHRRMWWYAMSTRVGAGPRYLWRSWTSTLTAICIRCRTWVSRNPRKIIKRILTNFSLCFITSSSLWLAVKPSLLARITIPFSFSNSSSKIKTRSFLNFFQSSGRPWAILKCKASITLKYAICTTGSARHRANTVKIRPRS